MNLKSFLSALLLLLIVFQTKASKILVYMDDDQSDHLKAYGITYWALEKGQEAEWLLNYRGGSFMLKHTTNNENELKIRGVSYTIVTNAKANAIYATINNPAVNMNVLKLLKVPKVAVYSPKSKQPWDDAVTLALTYAEIPYDVIFDDEIMTEKLALYDWLHLHHEDFSGQYGKFWSSYSRAPWYIQQVRENEEKAAKYGFNKVSELKLAVVKKIRDFAIGGGFLFAMCSATDTYDIALAANGVDICAPMFDGDPADPQAQSKLDFNNCFAFQDFTLVRSPYTYEFANIDVNPNMRGVTEKTDFFALFDFSAKWDVIPTILCQNHTRIIKGFMGQTTAFRKGLIKGNVTIMGENKMLNEAKYIHGTIGKGTWTFYGGHDPEDYRHYVGEAPTDLSLYPHSPGYRLILNNILFPSAKKKKLKT